MDVTYTHCAGLDVHKKTVVACAITPGLQGAKQVEIRTFGTMTADLLALIGLAARPPGHARGDGEHRRVLEADLQPPGRQLRLLVVNARHIKNVPGRKTDVKDAEWIADLLRHGLLRGSFIPPRRSVTCVT